MKYISIVISILLLSACSQFKVSDSNDPGLQKITPSAIVLNLKEKNEQELMQYFKTLKAPTFTQFVGPFKGTLLDSGNIYHNVRNKIATYNFYSGDWEGKRFFLTSEAHGYGYNMFGKINRRLKYPFNTKMSMSEFDGKPVLRMDYVPYPHILGKLKAYDEIREIDSNNYLLVSHFNGGILRFGPPLIIHLQRM